MSWNSIKSYQIYFSMNPQTCAFLTQSTSYSSLPSTYKVPRQYVNCQQILNKKLYGPTGSSKPQLTTKQKLQFQKKFYLDESISPSKNKPAPNKYLEKYSTEKRYKSQKTFITNPNENQKKLGKRPTWIEDIQKYEQKYQPPSVGNYNLLTKSDFSIPKKRQSIQLLLKNSRKFSNFDDSIYVGAQLPGPGSHNPKQIVSKLKVNMMNSNVWKKKQEQDQKRSQKRLDQNKTSSFSYSPVKDKTFDALQKQPKKDATIMKITSIIKRKGLSASVLSPGPGAHNVISRWASQTLQRQKLVGKVNIFAITTRSLPCLKVYH